jgi:hypothetical protein
MQGRGALLLGSREVEIDREGVISWLWLTVDGSVGGDIVDRLRRRIPIINMRVPKVNFDVY